MDIKQATKQPSKEPSKQPTNLMAHFSWAACLARLLLGHIHALVSLGGLHLLSTVEVHLGELLVMTSSLIISWFMNVYND